MKEDIGKTSVKASDIILYHGGYCAIEEPQFLVTQNYKDFGTGFYLTKYRKQAEKWALRNKNKRGKSQAVLNIYKYTPNDVLNIKDFQNLDKEWVEFIVNCRKGIPHTYDIVEGAMADDTIWNYLNSYISNEIPLSAFLELAKFNKPTHQICVCTPRALRQLKFIKSEVL